MSDLQKHGISNHSAKLRPIHFTNLAGADRIADQIADQIADHVADRIAERQPDQPAELRVADRHPYHTAANACTNDTCTDSTAEHGSDSHAGQGVAAAWARVLRQQQRRSVPGCRRPWRDPIKVDLPPAVRRSGGGCRAHSRDRQLAGRPSG